MDIPLDEVIHFDAITTTPSTGAAVDGDSAPTFAVYEEATDTDIGVGGNMTKRTSLTGNYRGTFTLSAANGFEIGKWYSVIGTGVVGGVTGKAVLKTFRVVAAEAIAGKAKVDVDALLGTAWLTPGTAGTPDVNVKLWNALATVALPLVPTTAGRTLTIEADGMAHADVKEHLGSAPNALVSGRYDSSVGAMAANVLTAAAMADGAIDAATFAADVDAEVLSYIVDDATRIDASQLNTHSAITVAGIADGVWDEDATGHQTQGTFGQAIGDPGSDSDTIWALANTNLNATVGSRASQTTADAIETDTQDIQNRLPAALTANGNIKASLVEILTTALTETSGLLAAAFKKFFNVASPTGTVNSLPDAVAGASGGVLIAGSNAATTFSGLTTGALSCTTFTASGAVAFQSTFAVTTSTSLAALSCTTLTASGAVALQSTVTVTGATSLAGLSMTTLTASGAVALQSTLIVTGATTLTGAVTATNASNDIRGAKLAATGLDLIVPADPSAIPALGTASIVTWIGYFGAWTVNEVNVTSSQAKLKNSAGSGDLATHAISDDGTTFQSEEPS